MDRVQVIAGGLAGIQAAPLKVPEDVPFSPFVISYPGRGRAEPHSKSWYESRMGIITEFHFSRQILPLAIEAAMPLFELFIEAIYGDATLGGKVEAIESITWDFGYLDWGTVRDAHIGWRFTIEAVRQPTF